tara:strand:+ start:486 stop:2024 length:1539 start_codon:yes stop_codon:yes gene_type:complete
MALPVVDTNQPEVKELISAGVKDISNMIFKSASVSITAAAKAVTPSIPQMVADITEDLRAGPVNRFSQGLEKLDKLLQNFGADIKDYSKELANFVNQREAKINKSEKTIRELRENNVKAEIDSMGDIQILSKFEIGQKEKLLEQRTTEIKELKEKISTNQKLVQEEKGNTKARRKAIVESQESIIKKEKERADLLELLNKREEDESDDARMTIRERASNIIEEYVPDGLRDIGSQFVEGLMAPVTAVKELGLIFRGLLKPLKVFLTPIKAIGTAFKKLGILLFGFLKKAAVLFKTFLIGLAGMVVAMIPFILKALLVVGALVVLKKAFDFLKEKVDENKEKLIEFKDKIVAIPGEVKDFFDKKFDELGVAFDGFVKDVKAIPGQISDFFKKIFNKIQNFFIDIINGAIDLFNKIPGIKDIEKLENIPMPADSPAEIVQAEGSPAIAAAQSGTGSGTGNALPPLNTNNNTSSVNNAAAVVNNNGVTNNSVSTSGASAKNNDYSRLSLYADDMP